jgi:hypothetical protein
MWINRPRKDTSRRGDWPLVEDDRDSYHRMDEARTPLWWIVLSWAVMAAVIAATLILV